MMKTTLDPELPPPVPAGPMRLSRRGTGSAISTLFLLSVKQQIRAQRMFIVVLLCALPVAFAILARVYNTSFFQADDVEIALVFYFMPTAIVPLTALLYATGMVQDEIEEQTLTYLLTRPLPKWSIYVAKMLATMLVTGLLVGAFTIATYIAIYAGSDDFWGKIFPVRALKTTALVTLALVSYSSLFGCLSLFVRRALVIGVAYIVFLEGVIAFVPFLVQEFTVMYHFRVLSERWLDLHPSDWSIDLDTAPDAQSCVLRLVVTSLVATGIAAVAFTWREFRVKTPEGA